MTFRLFSSQHISQFTSPYFHITVVTSKADKPSVILALAKEEGLDCLNAYDPGPPGQNDGNIHTMILLVK